MAGQSLPSEKPSELESVLAEIEAEKQEQLRQIRDGELSAEEATRRNFVLAKYAHSKILY